MVNIRVMVWNVRKFSMNKAQIPGFLPAVARTVLGSNVDVLVILEATKLGGGALGALAVTLRQLDQQPNHWAYTLSFPTGNERYGFFFRNLNVVRPTQFAPNPSLPLPPDLGQATLPVENLDEIQFASWPFPFPAQQQGPLPLPPAPAGPPSQPLIGPFYTQRLERPAKRKRGFAGTISSYKPGIGARQPCLTVFAVQDPANNAQAVSYIALVVCHFTAVRNSYDTNQLAREQIRQMSQLHITQKYAFRSAEHPNNPVTTGYINVNGAAALVRNLLIVGDSNVDFMTNEPNGNALARKNHDFAFAYLTPTLQRGGSVPPTAVQAQAAGAVKGPGGPLPVPQIPFPLPGLAPPPDAEIPHQALAPGVTMQGTILLPYSPPNWIHVQTQNNTAAMRGACIDLMFYGGPQLETAAVLGPANAGVADTALAVDVPLSVVNQNPNQAPPPGQIQLGQVQQHYLQPMGNVNHPANLPRHNANLANNLNAGGPNPPPLTLLDRWLGANMISDHVPVLLQFTCP